MYHQLYGGSSEFDGEKFVIHLNQQSNMSVKYDIRIPIEQHQSNLPTIANMACKKKKLDEVGPCFKSVMALWI